MTTPQRVQQQPAFLLHHRAFRDSSLLLDVFSEDHGKLALVARGARGQKSRLRGLLRPFMPLRLAWVMRTDLGTLTGAELDGQPLTLTGDALMSGFYANELVLQLLHRHDAQPELFSAYRQTVHALAATADIGESAVVLRKFEIEMLRLLGYAVNLDHEAGSSNPLNPDGYYEFRVEQGPVPVRREEGAMVFSGVQLIAIGAQHFDDNDVLRAAGRLLRSVIAFHLGGKELKTRKVLVDLHRSRARMAEANGSETK